MNPTSDLRSEHSAMQIILLAMKRLVYNIRVSINVPDIFRIRQIIDFLSIYTVHCHYEREGKGPFVELLELDIRQVAKPIHHLMTEHKFVQVYVETLNENIKICSSGQYVSFSSGNKEILQIN
jgi:hemerythrin-like domain-containing protein